MAGIAHSTRDLSSETSAEEKFRLAVEACPNGMMMTDGAGTIVLVNAEVERLFDYKRHELIGQPVEILIPEQLRNGHLQLRARFGHHPKPRRVGERRELFGRRRDGGEIPLEIGLNPIHTGNGLLVLSIIFDLSERKRVERLKDEFVSTVSHELRTPLFSIAGSLGLLTGGAAGALPEPAGRLIRIAQNNSQRLVRLINDILDIEKIESGQIAFKFKRLSARTLVEQVIEASRGFADGFHVRVRLDDDAAGEVYADPDRLAQVVTNLLSNAIKFSPPDGEVAVTVDQYGDSVRIAVRDHGHGIPREFRPRMFEKFAQADASDTRQKGGTGLGLNIVKQIVARLGGTVGFEDAVGGGTTFYVELPSWAQVAGYEIDAESGAREARILLCEDDLEIAHALRIGLGANGLKSDFAYSPASAITRAQTAAYVAILVDLDLPDGGGIDLIRRLRQLPQIYKTAIFVMCANGSWDKDGADAAHLNVSECLHKPIDIEHLTQILDRVAGHDGSGRAQILHVDDDQDVLEIVAQTLAEIATVVSVASIEDARCALLVNDFDLTILDIGLGAVSGLELLPHLHTAKGGPDSCHPLHRARRRPQGQPAGQGQL